MTHQPSFFSLPSGKQVKRAPGVKIIPREEMELLLGARDMVKETEQEAENYKIEIATECEKRKELAQAEGFEEGYGKWTELIARLEEEIAKVRKEYEKVLIPVALKAAKKIVGREIELSEDVIVDIVSTTLKPVITHKKITIYVNKKDLDTLEKNKASLKQLFESLESFAIKDRSDILPGGCVIETEGGIINAQLENQWRALEKAFDHLIKAKGVS